MIQKNNTYRNSASPEPAGVIAAGLGDRLGARRSGLVVGLCVLQLVGPFAFLFVNESGSFTVVVIVTIWMGICQGINAPNLQAIQVGTKSMS